MMSTGATNRSSTQSSRATIAGTQCSVQISSDHSGGEIDWNTVGEVGVKHVTDEVANVSAVDFKFGQGSNCTRGHSKPQSDWRYVHEKYDIMVFKKNVRGSPLTSFMGRGVIDVPLREVAEFLKKVENNLTWDNLLIEARYMKVLSESENYTDYLGYQRFSSTKCFVSTNRDLLYYVRCLYKDGNYIQAGVSVDDPEYVVPEGLKRVEVRIGSGWFVEPYNGSESRTLVTYIGNTDLKGIPPLIMNQVLKRHPLALHRIRLQLVDARLLKDTTPSGGADNPYDDDGLEQSFVADSSWTQSDGMSEDLEEKYEESVPTGHFLRQTHHSSN